MVCLWGKVKLQFTSSGLFFFSFPVAPIVDTGGCARCYSIVLLCLHRPIVRGYAEGYMPLPGSTGIHQSLAPLFWGSLPKKFGNLCVKQNTYDQTIGTTMQIKAVTNFFQKQEGTETELWQDRICGWERNKKQGLRCVAECGWKKERLWQGTRKKQREKAG